MRINVYSQELTSDVKLIEKKDDKGNTFSAVSLFLHSSDMLHQPPEHTGSDDDRSAVTLWLPRSESRREELAKTLEEMARLVRAAKSEVVADWELKSKCDIIDEIMTINPTNAELVSLAYAGLIGPSDSPAVKWRRNSLEVLHHRVLFEILKALSTQSMSIEWLKILNQQDWFRKLHLQPFK